MTDYTAAVIDELGFLKAQIAELEIKEKNLKGKLAHLAPGSYEGDLYRVSISVSERETLDMDAVRAKLSPQFITAHTNVTEVRTLRVAGRSGKKLAA